MFYFQLLYFNRNYLREVWNNDREIFGRLFPVLRQTISENPTDVFFFDVIPVIPPKFRQWKWSNGILEEDKQSYLLKEIISISNSLRAAEKAIKNKPTEQPTRAEWDLVKKLPGQTLLDKKEFAWLKLQECVNNMIADTSRCRDFQGVGFRQVIDL